MNTRTDIILKRFPAGTTVPPSAPKRYCRRPVVWNGDECKWLHLCDASECTCTFTTTREYR